MSFGFKTSNKKVSDAIGRAFYQNIIMFAAASNGGGNEGRAFPASDKRVICVHSTDGQGNRSKFSPTAKRGCENFGFPGESIESSWPRKTASSPCTKIKSGTSFATPLAVALAANLIEYVQQKLTAANDHVGRSIRRDDGLRAVFKLMAQERDGYEYITPWRLFGSENSELSINQRIADALRNI